MGTTSKEFQAPLDATVSLDVADAVIGIYESESNTISVETISHPKDHPPQIQQEGKVIRISTTRVGSGAGGKYNFNFGDVVFGGSYTSGNGVSIQQRNGEIHISGNPKRILLNGKEVQVIEENGVRDSSSIEKDPIETKIKLRVPKGINLAVTSNGECRIASGIELGSMIVNNQGVLQLGLKGKSLFVHDSGVGELKFLLAGGGLEVRCSGTASVEVEGCWSSASVKVSGTSTVVTKGVCRGDYEANVSGTGSITHKGEIKGKPSVRQTGTGFISI